jgi:hypothetical protein
MTMFPNARNSLRRWNDHGSSKIPIPIAATLHNLMTEQPPSRGEKKWFRPEHDGSLLPHVRLDIVVEGGAVVYSSESRKSAHPSWEHLDERIDLPGEWWLDESYYKFMKLRFTLLQTKTDTDTDTDTDINININPNTTIFLEVPIYPSILQRLNGTPEALPPNSCLVYFSDGSTRLPQNIFQVLLDSKLTEPPPIEDFSRFEDDAFRFLDQVPHTPSAPRARTASSLLEPDDQHLAESATNLFPEELKEHKDKVQSATIVSFDESEQAVAKKDIQMEKEFLEVLIAQEEAEMEQEFAALDQVRNAFLFPA